VRRLRCTRESSRPERGRLVRTDQTRLVYRTSRAPAVQPDRATIILGGAQTTQVSFPFPSGSKAGPDQTPGALERSAVIHFAARHIMISILRSLRRLRLATGKMAWSERTCNSAESSLICLISSTWDYL